MNAVPESLERTEGHRTYLDSVAGLPQSGSHAFIAFSIAAAFPRRMPTVHELRNRFGMSKATAYRWLATLRAARGEA